MTDPAGKSPSLWLDDFYGLTSMGMLLQDATIITLNAQREVLENADLLIEGTETGKTLRENRLKPIDLLYRSTTCVIGRKSPSLDGQRRAVFDHVLAALHRAGEAAGAV